MAMTSSGVPLRDFSAQSQIRSDSRSNISNKSSSQLSSTSSSVSASPVANLPTSGTLSRAGSGSSGLRNSSVSSNSVRNTAQGEEQQTSSSSGGEARDTPPANTRRPSLGLNFLVNFTNTIRSHSQHEQAIVEPLESRAFMANSPTIANFGTYNTNNNDEPTTPVGTSADTAEDELESPSSPVAQADDNRTDHETTDMDVTMVQPREPEPATEAVGGASGEPSTDAVTTTQEEVGASAKDKDGFYSLRLTPLIDHSSSSSGLYFAPIIRRTRSSQVIRIGRYTEKNKAAAHAPQGSDAPIVFKSKVVSRTHALFQCNEDGQWFVKDCKSSSGTFLNHIRLSPASQESSLMPLIDGDIIQLGMDYRGGTEEVYRCVKMRCEFNKSWQRKVNQFNLEIHQKLKNLSLQQGQPEADDNPLSNALKSDELSECAICLLKLEPCQALFISPCSHSWHYKCIRPIIIKSYPQFYCPNCRSMCDLETDIEDEDE